MFVTANRSSFLKGVNASLTANLHCCVDYY